MEIKFFSALKDFANKISGKISNYFPGEKNIDTKEPNINESNQFIFSAERLNDIIEKEKNLNDFGEERSLDYFAEPEDFIPSAKTVAAKTLPKNWNWIHYSDGSGYLENPEKNEYYFGYDKMPGHVAGYIEYKEISSKSYDYYWGSFDEFKLFAESIIEKRYLSSEMEQESEINSELLKQMANETYTNISPDITYGIEL